MKPSQHMWATKCSPRFQLFAVRPFADGLWLHVCFQWPCSTSAPWSTGNGWRHLASGKHREHILGAGWIAGCLHLQKGNNHDRLSALGSWSHKEVPHFSMCSSSGTQFCWSFWIHARQHVHVQLGGPGDPAIRWHHCWHHLRRARYTQLHQKASARADGLFAHGRHQSLAILGWAFVQGPSSQQSSKTSCEDRLASRRSGLGHSRCLCLGFMWQLFLQFVVC